MKGQGQHNCYRNLAMQFKYLTDDDPRWLYEILPAWELGERERYDLCDWACSRGHAKDKSELLKRAIINATMADEEDDESEKYSVFKLGLPPLNRLQKMYIRHTPQEYMQAMVLSDAVALGTILTGIRFRYVVDNKIHAFNFQVFVHGYPGKGKSCFEDLFDILLAPIREEDAKNAPIVLKYKLQKKNGVKKGEAEVPNVPLREICADITSAEYIRNMEACDGKHMILIDDEVSHFSRFDKKWGILKDLLIFGRDNKRWGSMRATSDGKTGFGRVYLNSFVIGTPHKQMEFIGDDVEGGLPSRGIHAFLEEAKILKFPLWSEKEKKEIWEWIEEWSAMQGMVYCPWVDEEVEKWLAEHKEDWMAKNDYGFQFYVRSAVIGCALGYLWSVVEGIERHSERAKCKGSQQEKDAAAYTRWCMDYIYYQAHTLFKKQIEKLGKLDVYSYSYTSNRGKYSPKKLLADLPAEFTKEEMYRLAKQHNYTTSLESPLSKWQSKGYVVAKVDETNRVVGYAKMR